MLDQSFLRQQTSNKRVFHHQLAKALTMLPVFTDQHIGLSAKSGLQNQSVPPLPLMALGQTSRIHHAGGRRAHHRKAGQAFDLGLRLCWREGRLQLARGDGVKLLQDLGAGHQGVLRESLGKSLDRTCLPHGITRVHATDEDVGVKKADHARPG